MNTLTPMSFDDVVEMEKKTACFQTASHVQAQDEPFQW